MPTPPHNDTPRQENFEEILKEFRSKFTKELSIAATIGTGHSYYEFLDNQESFLTQALTTSYTAGRASMRSDILAVVPEEKTCCANKNDGSVHEIACDGFNACRFELLAKIGGIE